MISVPSFNKLFSARLEANNFDDMFERFIRFLSSSQLKHCATDEDPLKSMSLYS